MKLILVIVFISISSALYGQDQQAHPKVYPNMDYSCHLGPDTVVYTYSDNQTDRLESRTCALSYSYYRCPSGRPTKACPKDKVKVVTLNKTIIFSRQGRHICMEKVQTLVKSLKGKNFDCSNTGIN